MGDIIKRNNRVKANNGIVKDKSELFMDLSCNINAKTFRVPSVNNAIHYLLPSKGIPMRIIGKTKKGNAKNPNAHVTRYSSISFNPTLLETSFRGLKKCV